MKRRVLEHIEEPSRGNQRRKKADALLDFLDKLGRDYAELRAFPCL